MNEAIAQIYHSAFRGAVNTNLFTCLSIFNFGNYQKASRAPFGNLQVFNDETLTPKSAISHTVNEDALILILPIAGAVDIELNNKKEFVHINQIQALSLKKGDVLSISNPYETEMVNYLHLQFRGESNLESLQNDFDLSTKNKLAPIFITDEIKIHIGIYDGRNEGTYVLKDSRNDLFTFIINGAFEFQNRLLETADGLLLSKTIKAEFEALSENAILLIIEEVNS